MKVNMRTFKASLNSTAPEFLQLKSLQTFGPTVPASVHLEVHLAKPNFE